MSKKRFQECNWLEKVWRYRFYIPIPFKYIWFMYIKDFVVRETALNEEKGHIEDTGEVYNPRGKNLWGLLKGTAQCDMNWTYTTEEVFSRLDRYFKDYDNGVH
jgi:hypothetical protein